jgi:hypothetical protein
MVASINAIAVRPHSPVSADVQPETVRCGRAIVNAASTAPVLVEAALEQGQVLQQVRLRDGDSSPIRASTHSSCQRAIRQLSRIL